MQDGEKIPAPGQLFYRGIDVEELIRGFTAHRQPRLGPVEVEGLPVKIVLLGGEGVGGDHREPGDEYGMGHAIYTLSDPRAVILKRFARKLAADKGMLDEFELFETVEKLTPGLFRIARKFNAAWRKKTRPDGV